MMLAILNAAASASQDASGAARTVKRRRLLVWGLIVLAAIVVLVASLTVWVKRQALDTDAWTKASSSLLQDDQVREALAVYIVDQLYANVDVKGELEDDLPPNTKGLAGPIAGALRAPAQRAVDRFLERPRVQQAWEELNRAAHQRLLAVLEGQPRPNVSTANGEVTLDLRSFLVDAGDEVGIGERLDATLPADAGQVTILRSDQLGTAQDAVKAVKALSWVFGIVAFGLWGLALWLAAGWRRVALRGIGASLLLLGLLLLIVRQVAGNYVVEALTMPGTVRDAGHSVWLLSTTLLAQIGWAGVLYGVAVLVGTWLAGPSRYAVAARTRLAPALRDRLGVAWAVVAGAFLLLVWWGPTPALRSPLGIIVLGAIAALGFELLRRQIAAEQAGATAPVPAASGSPG
jgi:hypothetical protein